ncbi:hypothetical protein MKX01_039197, partial [Papaver californicum]
CNTPQGRWGENNGKFTSSMSYYNQNYQLCILSGVVNSFIGKFLKYVQQVIYTAYIFNIFECARIVCI